MSRSFSIYGNTDSNSRMVFTGSIYANSELPYNIQIHDIDFVGNGGTGLSAMSSVIMTGCNFSGWDIGASVLDGGMIVADGCTFKDNKVAFKYDTGTFHSFSDEFPNCVIESNDIGIQFAKLRGQITIDFTKSKFIGNRIDIDNPINYPVKTEIVSENEMSTR